MGPERVQTLERSCVRQLSSGTRIPTNTSRPPSKAFRQSHSVQEIQSSFFPQAEIARILRKLRQILHIKENRLWARSINGVAPD
jgi:hypothetical protein